MAPVRGRRAACDTSFSTTTPTPSSLGETRTSFANSLLRPPSSLACAHVVLWTFTDICRLWALAQEGQEMSLAARGTTCVASGLLNVDVFPLSSVRLHRFLNDEDRAAVHEAGGSQDSAPRVGLSRPQVSSCSRSSSSGRHRGRSATRSNNALNGNTSPSAARSPLRSVRQRVHIANDDDLEPMLVLPATAPGAAADGPGRPYTDLEARLERLLLRGRELAGTLIRPEVDIQEMGIVAATEVHRRHILTMVPDWHNRPVILQLALGALAVYNLRPSDHTPVEEVNILWALEGNSHTLHLSRVLLADLRRGFLVVRSTACQGEDGGAGRSLP